MQSFDPLEQDIRAALERETRVNLHRSPIEVRRLEGGTVLLTGEADSIEEKRVAVLVAQSIAAVGRVIDRIGVRSTTQARDGEIRDSVYRRLSQEPVFLRAAIGCRIEGDTDVIAREPVDADNRLEISVSGGVVTLRGRALSLSHKRLAGVLAWWTPGCRDVINELQVVPPQQDNDDELCDAIELVLEKDPLVEADRVFLHVRNRHVTLHGSVANDAEKRIASQDVWYIDGVRDVTNELRIYPSAARYETVSMAASLRR